MWCSSCMEFWTLQWGGWQMGLGHMLLLLLTKAWTFGWEVPEVILPENIEVRLILAGSYPQGNPCRAIQAQIRNKSFRKILLKPTLRAYFVPSNAILDYTQFKMGAQDPSLAVLQY